MVSERGDIVSMTDRSGGAVMVLKIALFSKVGGTPVSHPTDQVLLGETGRRAKEKTDHFVPGLWLQARNKQRICAKILVLECSSLDKLWL